MREGGRVRGEGREGKRDGGRVRERGGRVRERGREGTKAVEDNFCSILGNKFAQTNLLDSYGNKLLLQSKISI